MNHSDDDAKAYRPNTFAERGVLVPFTTPHLVSARVRHSDRGGAELAMPSLSVGFGVYVVSCRNVREFCTPTVHDAFLIQKICAIENVSPSSVRQAGLAVAAEGLAGRDAAENAKIVMEKDEEDYKAAKSWLLTSIINGLNLSPTREHDDRSGSQPPELSTERVAVRVAPILGYQSSQVALWLDEIVRAFATIGTSPLFDNFRLGRALVTLKQFHTEMVRWSQEHGEESGVQAQAVAELAGATITSARLAVSKVSVLARCIISFLRKWADSPNLIAYAFAQVEWVMDGWERLCILWEISDNAAKRRAALAEIVTLLPILPREVHASKNQTANTTVISRSRGSARLNHDWRTGVDVFDFVTQNERLRAYAA